MPEGTRGGTTSPSTKGHSPLPWRTGPHYRSDIESSHGRVASCGSLGSPRSIADAAFIVEAVNALASLREENARLRAALDFNPFGQPISVKAESIDSAPDDADLPTIEQMSGFLNGGEGEAPSLKDYLERLRDD